MTAIYRVHFFAFYRFREGLGSKLGSKMPRHVPFLVHENNLIHFGSHLVVRVMDIDFFDEFFWTIAHPHGYDLRGNIVAADRGKRMSQVVGSQLVAVRCFPTNCLFIERNSAIRYIV